MNPGDPHSSYDLFRRRGALDRLMTPKSVAVLGASEVEGSPGRTVLWNLIRSPFGGTVFPVHPLRSNVLGIQAHRNVAALPVKPDLAVIAVPGEGVAAALEECATAGAGAAIVIAPADPATVRRAAGTMRVLGPGSLGLMHPGTGLNATNSRFTARAGSVAFLTQSGALGTAVLDWGLREEVGFSLFASVGSMAGVDWGELIDFLGTHPATRSILIYLETVGDARRFVSAAREVALSKPILVIQGGRAREGDPALDAAFARCGVLRVGSIADLFYMAEVLARQPRPKGPRLALVTNANGPALLASDSAALNGLEVAEVRNLTFDTKAERYALAVEELGRTPGVDGTLVILTPHAAVDPARTARALAPLARTTGKPLLASWMGGTEAAAGVEVLNGAGIPTFAYPDTAARVFSYMWVYARNLRALYETPAFADELEWDVEAAGSVIAAARAEGRDRLTPEEARQVFGSYRMGLELPASEVPVAAGSVTDARFGPVIWFGAGGEIGRLFGDRGWALPPLNATLAKRLMETTRVWGAIPAGAIEDWERLLVRLSRLVVEQPWIRELEVGGGIKLHRDEPPGSAIRPYPVQYVSHATTRSGMAATIRPIRPEDEPLMVRFHQDLSDRTVYQRYLQALNLDERIAHERLVRICFNDYTRDLALVAEVPARDIAGPGGTVIAGVARLARIGPEEAELAIVVADPYQGQGLGKALMERLVSAGESEGLRRIVAETAPDNGAMQHLFRQLGFRLKRELDDPVVTVLLELPRPDSQSSREDSR
jgi:acyl-CoA synthetase (NDP forming)/RimJ/RimL family protein N-acetyltransferase